MSESRFRAVGGLIKSVVADHPWRVALSIALMLLVGLLEGLTVGLVAPLLSLVGLGAPPGVRQRFFGMFDLLGIAPSLEVVLLLAIAGVILEHSIRFIERRYTRNFVGARIAELRVALYDAYLRSRWSYWTGKNIGHTSGMLTLECYRALSAVVELMAFLAEMALIVALVALAFFLSWPVALLFVGIGAAVGVLLRRGVLTGYGEGASLSAWNSALQRAVHENLAAAKLIKASAMESSSVSKLKDIADTLNHVEVGGAITPYRAAAVFAPLVISLLCGGLYLALTVFSVDPAAVLVLLLALNRASARVIVAQRAWHMMMLNAPAYVALRSELAEAIAAQEPQLGENAPTTCPTLAEAVELQEVSFAHRADMPLLRGVSIRIPARTTVAIVGGSGAGKTTILDLVLGLLEPGAGSVQVDGVDLRRVSRREWRAKLSYVGQDVVLFDDTIAGNIRWGRPDASDEAVMHAARLAHATGFIEAIPEGFAAKVGDRGIRLSGGERQRIALARALIREPSLLVLDEATSSLDAESEYSIQNAIEGLRSRLTILIVAHRLSTVRSADWIYVIEHGQVVQEGSWDTLVAASGAFSRMWALQSQTVPAAVR